MPITSSQVPPDGIRVLSENFSAILADPELTEFVMDIQPSQLSVTTLPHEAFFVDVEDVAQGLLLSKARAAYWRYLTVSGSIETRANIRVEGIVLETALSLKPGQDGHHVFEGTCRSPDGKATLEAIAFALKLPDVLQNQFELAFLQIVEMHVSAIWLHGEKDILIPLSDAHGLLTPMTVYSEQDMIGPLQEAAKEMMDIHELPDPTPDPHFGPLGGRA